MSKKIKPIQIDAGIVNIGLMELYKIILLDNEKKHSELKEAISKLEKRLHDLEKMHGVI